MHFLNPLALLGLAAALIPLAIHLLHRGRTRPVPFSNLRFLRRLEQSRMRRIRLRQWLALLLRTLVIALVVAAYARPAYRHNAGWGGQNPPVAAVILVDVSYSTGFRMADGPLFPGLQRLTLALLELFGSRDRVTLVPFAAQARAVTATEPARLADAVRGLAVTEEATDLAAALGEATAVLGQAEPGTERELYLVTDLAGHGWTGWDRPCPSSRSTDLRDRPAGP
ncbi:MAG: BatA and WFA domain-containing protein [Candidatus Latescibacterota bacterium]